MFMLSFLFGVLHFLLSFCYSALSVGIRICWLYALLGRGIRVPYTLTHTHTLLRSALNCIWLWDSSSGSLEFAENLWSVLPGPLWQEMVVPVMVSSILEIDLFENHLYSLEWCAKKIIRKNYTQNVNMNI